MHKTSDPLALKRQHRMIGLFATLLCWRSGWDGVAINRGHLGRLFGVKRFE